MSCPMCEGENLRVKQYDFGIDNETGYLDFGWWFKCEDCKAEGEYKTWDLGRETHLS